MDILLSPPVAFLLYIPLVGLIALLGRTLAGPEHANPMKSSLYGSGEEAPTNAAAPGYKPFFPDRLLLRVPAPGHSGSGYRRVQLDHRRLPDWPCPSVDSPDIGLRVLKRYNMSNIVGLEQE